MFSQCTKVIYYSSLPVENVLYCYSKIFQRRQQGVSQKFSAVIEGQIRVRWNDSSTGLQVQCTMFVTNQKEHNNSVIESLSLSENKLHVSRSSIIRTGSIVKNAL